VTDADKDKYVQEIFEKEKILLEKDKIELNPAKKTIAKLFLNAFYG